MDVPLGTLRTDDGTPVLRFERRLDHPAEKVWRAVTDPDEMRFWFPAAVRTEPRVGAPMRFSFGEDESMDAAAMEEGEVLEFDPPKVYVFRWNDSVLRFEIVPDGAGCRLLFSHALDGQGTWGDLPSAARQASGWHMCLAQLQARLSGRPAEPADVAWLPLAERYVEAFGLAEGEVQDRPGEYEVRFERDLVQPPDAVWALLTEGGGPGVGDEPPLRATHGHLEPGAVTAVEEARVLEYGVLVDGEPAGRVRFELRVQTPIGTRLVLTQTLPARPGEGRAVALAAWQVHLELLFAALGGEVRCPWPAERTEELRRRYAERLDRKG